MHDSPLNVNTWMQPIGSAGGLLNVARAKHTPSFKYHWEMPSQRKAMWTRCRPEHSSPSPTTCKNSGLNERENDVQARITLLFVKMKMQYLHAGLSRMTRIECAVIKPNVHRQKRVSSLCSSNYRVMSWIQSPVSKPEWHLLLLLQSCNQVALQTTHRSM